MILPSISPRRSHRPARLSGGRLALGLLVAATAWAAAACTNPQPGGVRPGKNSTPVLSGERVEPGETGQPGFETRTSDYVLLHTNDVHGQLLPRAATWIDKRNPPSAGGLVAFAKVRAQIGASAANVFAVDTGDWFTGTPEGALDGGVVFTQALVLAGNYDAMALGNHEFDLGLANLKQVLEVSGAPAVCANLRDTSTGERVTWVEPWRIVERGGLRVAFVGLLSPDTPAMCPSMSDADKASITFTDPGDELERAISELQGQCDLVVPLTHLGHDEDLALAKRFPTLPLIVGGHSHTFLAQGAHQGDVLVVQAGSRLGGLGRVDLRSEQGRFPPPNVRASIVSLVDFEVPDLKVPAVEAACAAILQRSGEQMAVVVGELSAPLQRGSGFASSGAGNLVTDAIRGATGADVALINRWGLRSDLQAGPVDRRALFELLPFGNHVSVAELTGAELWAVLTKSVGPLHEQGLEWSGLVVDVRPGADAAADGGAELVAVAVGGEPLDLQRVYSVAAADFLFGGGDGFIDLERQLAPKVIPALQRDMVEALLSANRPYAPDTGDRYRIVSEK